MRNNTLAAFFVLVSFASFASCDGGNASDAGIDAEAGVQADVAQDNGPIGPDVQSIDAMDASEQ